MRLMNGFAPLAGTHASPRCSAGVQVVLAMLAEVRQPTVWISLEINPKRVEQAVERVLKIQPSQSGFMIGSTKL